VKRSFGQGPEQIDRWVSGAAVYSPSDLNVDPRDNLNYLNGVVDIMPTIYSPTLADVVNTSVQTTTLSFPVPANAMADETKAGFFSAVISELGLFAFSWLRSDW
jgi:hypothetical protein